MSFAAFWTAVLASLLTVFGCVVLGWQSPTGQYYTCCSSNVHRTTPLSLGSFIGALIMFANLTLVCSVLFGEFEVRWFLVTDWLRVSSKQLVPVFVYSSATFGSICCGNCPDSEVGLFHSFTHPLLQICYSCFIILYQIECLDLYCRFEITNERDSEKEKTAIITTIPPWNDRVWHSASCACSWLYSTQDLQRWPFRFRIPSLRSTRKTSERKPWRRHITTIITPTNWHRILRITHTPHIIIPTALTAMDSTVTLENDLMFIEVQEGLVRAV